MCFGKAFHLILMHFYFLSSMLWGVFTKVRLFFKKDVFPDFRLVQSVFRSIEILFKNFGEPLSGSIDRINRTSWIRFFKTWILTFSKVLQVFSLSLIQTWLPLRVLFFFFYLSFCKVSLSKHRYDPFTPYFCFYFHISRIFNLGISNYA